MGTQNISRVSWWPKRTAKRPKTSITSKNQPIHSQLVQRPFARMAKRRWFGANKLTCDNVISFPPSLKVIVYQIQSQTNKQTNDPQTCQTNMLVNIVQTPRHLTMFESTKRIISHIC